MLFSMPPINVCGLLQMFFDLCLLTVWVLYFFRKKISKNLEMTIIIQSISRDSFASMSGIKSCIKKDSKKWNFSNLFGENAALIKRNSILLSSVLFVYFLISCCTCASFCFFFTVLFPPLPLWLIKRPRYLFFSSIFFCLNPLLSCCSFPDLSDTHYQWFVYVFICHKMILFPRLCNNVAKFVGRADWEDLGWFYCFYFSYII